MPENAEIAETLEAIREWRKLNACERCGGVGKITRFDICPVCEGEGSVESTDEAD